MELKRYAKIAIGTSLAVLLGAVSLVYLPSLTSAGPDSSWNTNNCKNATWNYPEPGCNPRLIKMPPEKTEPEKPKKPQLTTRQELEMEKQRINRKKSEPKKPQLTMRQELEMEKQRINKKRSEPKKSTSKPKPTSNVPSKPKNTYHPPVAKQPNYKSPSKTTASNKVSKNNPAIDPGSKSSYIKGCSATFPGRNQFKLGQSNKNVTCLGKLLVIAGFDGHYKQGPSPKFTEADRLNVQRFQLAQGWKGTQYGGDADGYPGPGTWNALVSKAKEKGFKF